MQDMFMAKKAKVNIWKIRFHNQQVGVQQLSQLMLPVDRRREKISIHG